MINVSVFQIICYKFENKMDHRSPLENIFNVIGGLPQGHDKPVKHALYNAVALFLLILCCAAGWALFIILEPFIKPLIWALLVGSVLHPLKHSLREQFNSWISNIERSGTPIVIGLFILPINIVNDLSEFLGNNLLKYIKVIVVLCLGIPALVVLYYYTPTIILTILWNSGLCIYNVVDFLISSASIFAISMVTVLYVSILVLMWTPENNNKFHYASLGMWILLSCAIAHLFGSFQMPVFIALQVIFYAGFVSEIYEIYTDLNDSEHKISLLESFSCVFHGKTDPTSIENKAILEQKEVKTDDDKQSQDTPANKAKEINSAGDVASSLSISAADSSPKLTKRNPWSLDLFEEVKPKPVHTGLSNASIVITNKGNVHVIPDHLRTSGTSNKDLHRSLSQPHVNSSPLFRSRTPMYLLNRKTNKPKITNVCDTDCGSDFYLYSLLWACFIMLVWKNMMLLPILLIPILIYSLKHFGYYLGIWSTLHGYTSKLTDTLYGWCEARFDAIVPAPIRGLYKAVEKANVTLKNAVKDSIDTVASCVVISLLIIFVACASLFIVFQIYTETIMLVQMFSNVINQTVVHNPELRQLLPPTWDDTMDSILDNAYQYGREGISKAVRSMVNDVDSAKSIKLEQQVLELFDRVYQAWMSSDEENGPKVTKVAVQSSWDAFLHDIQKSPEMFNINGLTEFAKQNIGTLMSLMESVWAIVKGNISLILGSFSAFVSVLLGGGTAVLNFILNVIVFLTTLFYLLSSSGELYKPVQLMTNFSSSGSRFGLALEGAVNGVFKASFKMAAFYGLWTWFIHNLFGVNIVYLPSAFAMILGAVPFLGTYWACIPAVLDLWLAQGQGLLAILFAIFQFLPTSVVDTTIYKEIKGGGHPYLTGLAIAGGIFCLGVEGAIIGPLLLCGLYVAIDLSSSLFKDSPSEESLNLQLNLTS